MDEAKNLPINAYHDVPQPPNEAVYWKWTHYINDTGHATCRLGGEAFFQLEPLGYGLTGAGSIFGLTVCRAFVQVAFPPPHMHFPQATILAASLLCIGSTAVGQVLYDPTYSLTLFANATSSRDDLDVDSTGRVYAPDSGGVTRFDTSGNSTLWSSASGYSLALATDGTGYLTTRFPDNSILRIYPNGTFDTLVSSATNLEWTWVALASDGTLFSNVAAGPGQGLYTIDRSTGAYSLVVSGGPGPGGSGIIYENMVWGPDNHLYVAGLDNSEWGVFRLDGSAFTRVAVLPHAGIGLAFDAKGTLFTATTYGDLGEIWRVDLQTGIADLFGSGFDTPAGIAYDDSLNALLVREQGSPYNIFAITQTVPEPASIIFLLFGSLLGAVQFLRRRHSSLTVARFKNATLTERRYKNSSAR